MSKHSGPSEGARWVQLSRPVALITLSSPAHARLARFWPYKLNNYCSSLSLVQLCRQMWRRFGTPKEQRSYAETNETRGCCHNTHKYCVCSSANCTNSGVCEDLQPPCARVYRAPGYIRHSISSFGSHCTHTSHAAYVTKTYKPNKWGVKI